MKRAGLATLIALGLTVSSWTGKAQAEERLTPVQRHDRIRYETLQRPQWTLTETLLTIRAAADRFNVSQGTMLCIANRESNYDEDAVNSSSGASGLFQHIRSYWPGRVDAYNRSVDQWREVKSNASPFSARANSLVTAWMIHRGGLGPWGGGC